EDGLDEITVCDGTRISQFRGPDVETFYVTPESFGIRPAQRDEILGGGKDLNAAITMAILKGEAGAKRDMVLINAAAALVVAGTAPDFQIGITQAVDAIDSGLALAKLKQVRQLTSSL
ncbi:MAG TPA: anthranilate phosphoribosyltransferase, partial [Dissulfurispiraceae bacterium]|nr:anthranilate phosphoribosyltransferase [Dissulfurispiraceae bacterium]